MDESYNELIDEIEKEIQNIEKQTLMEKKQLDQIKQARVKQEQWRQKQIDIFYRTGRPIFIHKEYHNPNYFIMYNK